MTITAQMVKDLREKTGAGMMDSKKALEASGGNLDAAIKYLREKGLAAAKKKADRVASEGLVGIAVNGTTAALVEVNCETDFVARNKDFEGLVSDLATMLSSKTSQAGTGIVDDIAPLMNEKLSNGSTVEATINEKTASIGEKLSVRRFARFDKGNLFGSYIHGTGNIGVLVEFVVEGNAQNPTLETVARDVAMHIAASTPLFVRKEEVDQKRMQEEREIFRNIALKEGKPEKIIDKIVDGKMEKFFADACLLEQPFVKDPDLSISKLLAKTEKDTGSTIKITRFARFKVGEGLEKRSDDFLQEVSRMAS